MNWKPSFALVLLGVSLVTYWGGWVLQMRDGEEKKTEEKKRRKRLVWLFALIGLLPLLIFKYYNFINNSISDGLAAIGMHFSLPGLNWAIPVGISFFTFQAVGYMLDVYHQRVPVEKDLLTYLLFVSFFPQVTSGPISTPRDLMPQFKSVRTFDYDQAKNGLKVLLWGMFLKLALADRIGIYVDTVYTNYIHYPGAVCLFASFMYTIQIYADFAGYSLMAVGIAKTLGFNLINNFERPYLAASVTEFWKRWHISLTRWLTTHVYINLGGNRCSKIRQYFNILITFLVSGLWHGANWTFIIWGALHGVFQIVEKALMSDRIKSELKSGNTRLSVARLIRIFITFNLVNLAWIFFRMPDLGSTFDLFHHILNNFGHFMKDPMDSRTIIGAGGAIVVLLVKDLYDEYRPALLTRFVNSYTRWVFYLFLACYIMALGVLSAGQFIYVTF